ncbi:PaaI family thioesterase [Ottowia sp.]|uniref:PaaI family thioesterase n=1 Tax=Ottowia sp. TaxID=1898956 RepID=UPI0026353A8B|nr:PaaI family thioesterase [Ottowia sp.]HPK32771.1 PaaI family thioesterase [Ottowia sp.]HRW73049.1 PaaI family thioesterase [Ottowia sp.]
MNPIPNAPSVERVRRAVLAMPMAQTLALAFDTIGAGTSTLRAPVQPGWCFAPGQLQATAMFALADFAAVSAAGTLLPEGWANSTVDASVKFVAPARGTHIVARGRVVQPGKTLSVCAADVFAVDAEGREQLCATWLGTARNFALAG